MIMLSYPIIDVVHSPNNILDGSQTTAHGARSTSPPDHEAAAPAPVQVNKEDAQKLHAAGCTIVAEGANMPSDPEAIHLYHSKVCRP